MMIMISPNTTPADTNTFTSDILASTLSETVNACVAFITGMEVATDADRSSVSSKRNSKKSHNLTDLIKT